MTDTDTRLRRAAAADASSLAALWRDAMEPDWPLSADLLRRVFHEQAIAFVAEDNRGRIIGSVCAHAADGESGSLVVLLVAPDARRQGVGTRLHAAALDRLRTAGVRRVQLGGGGSPRLWPGVPENLADARAFFAARGWTYTETSYDLTQDMRAYATPPPVRQRGETAGIRFATAAPGDVPALLAFTATAFPSWADAYRQVAETGDLDDLLFARAAGGEIVGALILYGAWSHPARNDVLWKSLLGPEAGALGCVGVAKAWRDRGVGSALVARGSEIVQERGAGVCLVGWTWLLDFYGRLGYTVWHENAMSWRDTNPAPATAAHPHVSDTIE